MRLPLVALGRIHDAGSAAVLAQVIARGNERNRGEAAMSLASIGGEEAERALIAALGDPVAGVRWRACQSLASMATGSSLPALERLDRDERDPNVREHLARALARARPASGPRGPGHPTPPVDTRRGLPGGGGSATLVSDADQRGFGLS